MIGERDAAEPQPKPPRPNQADYELEALLSLTDLTTRLEGLFFSVRQVAENSIRCNSLNRAWFALLALSESGHVHPMPCARDSLALEDGEPVDYDDPIFSVTALGISRSDDENRQREAIDTGQLVYQTGELKLLVTIFLACRKSIFSYFHWDDTSKFEKINLNRLIDLNLIRPYFFKDVFVITNEGREFLIEEAKARGFKLDNFIKGVIGN